MIAAVAERADQLKQLCLRYRVLRLGLFGSAATGAYQPEESDLDFVVEFQPAAFGAYADAYFGLLESLEQLFGKPVDLVVASAIKNPYFLQSVQETRTPIYEARDQPSATPRAPIEADLKGPGLGGIDGRGSDWRPL